MRLIKAIVTLLVVELAAEGVIYAGRKLNEAIQKRKVSKTERGMIVELDESCYEVISE